jgi:hypothetical protein
VWSAAPNDVGVDTGTPLRAGPSARRAATNKTISSLATDDRLLRRRPPPDVSATVSTPSGWAFSQTDGKFFATNKSGGKDLDESDLERCRQRRSNRRSWAGTGWSAGEMADGCRA